MNKAGAVLIVLVSCGLATRAFAQGKELRVHSTTDEMAKIGDLLEEFRQDISQRWPRPDEAHAEFQRAFPFD
jgi:hypothetical protein